MTSQDLLTRLLTILENGRDQRSKFSGLPPDAHLRCAHIRWLRQRKADGGHVRATPLTAQLFTGSPPLDLLDHRLQPGLGFGLPPRPLPSVQPLRHPRHPHDCAGAGGDAHAEIHLRSAPHQGLCRPSPNRDLHCRFQVGAPVPPLGRCPFASSPSRLAVADPPPSSSQRIIPSL